MNTKHLSIAFLCWVPTWIAHSAVGPTAAFGQELPSASSLMDAHIRAIGGQAAVESHRSRRLSGTFHTRGIEGTVEVLTAAPAMSRILIEIPRFGEVDSGYDGEIGWRITPTFGPEVLQGRTLDQARQNADFYRPLGSERFIASQETVEMTELEGRAAYRVEVTTVWDEEYSVLYDVETGRLVASIRTFETPLGDAETTTIFRDYRAVDGVWVPVTWIQRSALSGEQVFEFDTVEFDVVEETAFEMPSQIRSLVESSDAAAAERR